MTPFHWAMLTPVFELGQSASHVEISLKVPFIKTQNIDLFVEGSQFKLSAHPYFLNLSLPGLLSEDEADQAASLDISTGNLKVSVKKAVLGMDFPDLDLLTKICKPKEPLRMTKPPLVEVISEAGAESRVDLDEMDSDLEIDWNMPTELPAPTLGAARYGFNQMYSGYEPQIHALAHEVLEIESLESSDNAQRNRFRIDCENDGFSREHYMYDFMNPPDAEILAFKPESHRLLKLAQTGADVVMEFTEKEREAMLSLKNREYLMSADEARIVYLGLVDILFAYCYDQRINMGDTSVESGWNVAKLSATLCCFIHHGTIELVAASGIR